MSDPPQGFPSIGDVMSKMAELKERMDRVEQGLAQERVTAESGAGMVKAVASGRRELVSLELEPDLWSSHDVTMVQDLIVAAVNAALARADRLAKERMEATFGGMLGGSLPFRLG
jgi:hypothetical protein